MRYLNMFLAAVAILGIITENDGLAALCCIGILGVEILTGDDS